MRPGMHLELVQECHGMCDTRRDQAAAAIVAWNSSKI